MSRKSKQKVEAIQPEGDAPEARKSNSYGAILEEARRKRKARALKAKNDGK